MPVSFADSCQRILDATQRLTFSRGVSALRMDDLAYELGMSKKTIYACYPSKEALLTAMVDAYYQHYEALFQAVLDAPSFRFVDGLQQAMQLGWEMSSALSDEVAQDFRRHAPGLLHNFRQRTATAVRRHFQRLLAVGQRQGLLRPELSLAIIEDILLEAITYRLTPSSLHDKAYTMPEAAATFYHVLFAGLLSEGTRQHYQQNT